LVKGKDVSRSKHTDPKTIRAMRRIRSPRDKRDVGDLSRRRKLGLQTKRIGAAFVQRPTNVNGHPRLRIIVRSPRLGFHHPAGERDILELLNALGPIPRYGLHSIDLAPSLATGTASPLVFGRYCAPGRVILFEQAVPPWRLPGLLPETMVRRFARVGATVTLLADVRASLVDWPEGTLRRFMLQDVFLHELGHHVLQHYKGKRSVQIARTSDHEAFASRFVEKHRSIVKADGR
jgi:hypothetical protein